MRIIIADIEGTGLKMPAPPASGVVQVAHIDIAWDPVQRKAVETGSFSAMVDPGCPIEPKATEVHGFTDDDVLGKPSLEEVYHIPEPVYFIAYNRPFDYKRLAGRMDNCVGGFCALQAARRYLKGPTNYQLQTLVEFYDLPRHKAHDALGDVRSTLDVLNLIMQASDFSNLQDLGAAINTPKVPELMPFGKHQGKSFRDLPSDYIVFVLGFEDLDPGLRTALEMQRRLRGNGI